MATNARPHLNPGAVQLIAAGGLSGTGKSTFARNLARRLEESQENPVIILRSDVIRKELYGVAETERLPPAAYSEEMSLRVMQTIEERATAALKNGRSVIADATYMDKAFRDSIANTAKAAQVPFTGFWLQAEEDVLIARVSARKNDASDAGPEIVRKQLASAAKNPPEKEGWHRLDAGGTPDSVLAQAQDLFLPASRGFPGRNCWKPPQPPRP